MYFLRRIHWILFFSDPPSDLDPVMSDTSLRLQICDDISNSVVFKLYGKSSSNIERFGNDFYSRTVLQLFGLKHAYMPREFKIVEIPPRFPGRKPISVHKNEHVFPCLLKEDHTNISFPFYVSKLYNAANGFSAHRFRFPEKLFSLNKDIMLVEGSAKTYMNPTFNIELHYLELRKNYQPGRYRCVLFNIEKNFSSSISVSLIKIRMYFPRVTQKN